MKYSWGYIAPLKALPPHIAPTAKFKRGAFHDPYRDNVERLIEEKKKGEKKTTVKQRRKAPVIDLLEALKKSL